MSRFQKPKYKRFGHPIFWTFPNPYESAYVGMRQTSENDDHPDLTQCIGENKPVGYTGRLVDLL